MRIVIHDAYYCWCCYYDWNRFVCKI